MTMLTSRRLLLTALSLAAAIPAIAFVGSALQLPGPFGVFPFVWLGLGLFLGGTAAVASASRRPGSRHQDDRPYLLALGVGVVLLGVGFFLGTAIPGSLLCQAGLLCGGLGTVLVTATILKLAREKRIRAKNPSEVEDSQLLLAAGLGCSLTMVLWVLVAEGQRGQWNRWFWGLEAFAFTLGVLAVTCSRVARRVRTSSWATIAIGLVLSALGVALFGTSFLSPGWIPLHQGRQVILTGLWLAGFGCAVLGVSAGRAALGVRHSPESRVIVGALPPA